MCALVTGVQTCALPIWRSDYRPKNDKTPVCISRQGSWEFNLDDDLLSHGETPHYHRRCIVSLLSSGWDQVVPMLYGRQEILWPARSTATCQRKSITSTKTKPLPASADRGFGI